MENKLISANAVRELCGGVSDMTLWRWLTHPELDFPKPIYIGTRGYWREVNLFAWMQSRAEACGVEL